MTTGTLDPAVRGNQTTGPARWARAKQWAEHRPGTAMARVYRERVAAAEAIAAMGPDREWEVWRRNWHTGETTFAFRCCSTRCAVMQFQLTAHWPSGNLRSGKVTGLEQVKDYAALPKTMMNTLLVAGTGRRKGACSVCGKAA